MNLSKTVLVSIFAIGLLPLAATAQGALPSDLPTPNAKPGQCFARVLVPAKYEQVPMSVAVSDPYSTFQISEPVFSPARDEVRVVQDGYKDYQVTPGKWQDVSETVVIRPEHNRLVLNKANFVQKTETYIIKEPRFVWRPGTNLSGVKRLDANTGEVFCLVEERGVTETVTRQVLKDKANVGIVKVPAQTATYVRKVLVEAPKVISIDRPALTKAFKVHDLIKEAGAVEVTQPGQTKTVYQQKLVAAEHYAWVQVECDNSKVSSVDVNLGGNDDNGYEKPVTKVTASDVQKRLAKLGFYRGPIDNIYGRMTKDAMAKFQASKGLNVSGNADIASLKALGF